MPENSRLHQIHSDLRDQGLAPGSVAYRKAEGEAKTVLCAGYNRVVSCDNCGYYDFCTVRIDYARAKAGIR